MFGSRDIYSSSPPLWAPSFRKMFTFAVVNVIAREGKWQVSWCQVPLSSILLDEESDRIKVEVNKVRLGQRQSGPCRFLSQSLTSPGRFTTGSQIKRKKKKTWQRCFTCESCLQLHWSWNDVSRCAAKTKLTLTAKISALNYEPVTFGKLRLSECFRIELIISLSCHSVCEDAFGTIIM